MHRLITDFQFELIPDHHSPGSLKFGVMVKFPTDISPVMPYLNARLKDTRYNHADQILIGAEGIRKYAFRAHQIQFGLSEDTSHAASAAEQAVELVNKTWEERDRIVPSTRESKLPGVYDVFRLLPKKNCRKCGCSTCLAFADELRNGRTRLESCPVLSDDSRNCIAGLFEAA